jgi:undecaprenyldiphospho-muramoylpentapeptide beta-N-acetylglucosaminyltransferase
MAVADELRASGAEVTFLGTRDRIEAELVPAAGYEIDFIKVRGIDRRNPLLAARAALEAAAAIGAARRALYRRGAEVVMVGGGFVAGPAGVAAALTRTPLVLTEADSHLGLANRLLARRARRVCLAFPIEGRDGERYLLTGRPVPSAVLAAERGAARRRFGIAAETRCLLVVGGSQGARSLNLAAIEAFAERDGRDFDVLHLAGRRDHAELEDRLAAAPHRDRYTLLDYEPDLSDVLAASDLVLGRSGGSVFEVAAVGRPAILVPYPHATADHQSANAEWMRAGGAATVLPDAELDAERLRFEVAGLLGDERRLGEMAAAARKLARPDAALRIANEVLAAAGGDGPRTGKHGPEIGPSTGGGPVSSPRDWAGRQLHFIGIGGAGMSGLALVCARLGATVTGSDRADSSYMERLRDAGLEPAVGHDPANLPEGAEVVVSTAIGDDNPELGFARERGVEPIHRGALLAQLCAEKRLIAVAGTHGKTTTTAMAVWALRAIGADPAFFIGGEVLGLGPGGAAANAGWGEGEWVVAEADESDASFLELRPEVAVITNVEMDHHSRWGSLAELRGAFARFLEPSRAAVLPAEGDLASVAEVKEQVRFDPSSPGPAELGLIVPGRHNLLNARAALAAIGLAGLDTAAAAKELVTFPGVRRRLEMKGLRDSSPRVAPIYDDYAHHPTEIRAALLALREFEPGLLIAVFQPHLYSRTKAFSEAFGAALSLADEVAVLDVYPAREQPVGELAGVSGLSVARAAADRMDGRPVWWLPTIEAARRALAERLDRRGGPQGDWILVTIGAGDVVRLGEELVGGAA